MIERLAQTWPVRNLKELEQAGSSCHLHQVEMHLQTGTDIEDKGKGDCALYGDKHIYTSIIIGRTAPLSRLHISFIAVMQIWMSLSFLGLERAAFDQLPGWVFYVSCTSMEKWYKKIIY